MIITLNSRNTYFDTLKMSF